MLENLFAHVLDEQFVNGRLVCSPASGSHHKSMVTGGSRVSSRVRRVCLCVSQQKLLGVVEV